MATETWGENSADDYNSRVEDWRPWEGDPTNPNNTIVNLTTGEASGNYRSFLIIKPKQDIPGETINSAILKIRKYGGTQGNDVKCYRVLQNCVVGEADWDEYSVGNSWNTAGCDAANDSGTDDDASYDRHATALDTVVSGSNGIFYEWDITSLVQGWVDGTIKEYGVILIDVDGEAATAEFQNWDASEATDGRRPYLEITYGEAGQDSGEAIPLNVYT
jgi:hypothetical protein